MKRTHLIVTAGLVSLATVSGIGIASAATGTKPASLASEIATKFHLNQGDVQSVINQHHQETQAWREQNYQQRLDNAVSQGKITSAQEQLILQKHTEIINFVKSLQGQTPQQRHQAMEQERQQVQQWAQQNNVPLQLLGGFGRGRMIGPKF